MAVTAGLSLRRELLRLELGCQQGFLWHITGLGNLSGGPKLFRRKSKAVALGLRKLSDVGYATHAAT